MELPICESYNDNARKQIDESVYDGNNKTDLAEVLLSIYNSEDQDSYETYAQYHDSELLDELLASNYITTEQGNGGDFLTLTDTGMEVVNKIANLF